MKRAIAIPGAAVCAFLLAGGAARAGRLLTSMNDDGGNGIYVNLIVREVKVTPVRAHVGDIIRIDAVIQNQGEGAGTIPVRVYANGKPVAGRLFSYDTMIGPNPVYRESFAWDTSGATPGEYRISVEAFDWDDASPFDNSLDVKEPVTLLPAGAALPAGQPGGGTAVAVDPRWRPESGRAPGESKSGAAGY